MPGQEWKTNEIERGIIKETQENDEMELMNTQLNKWSHLWVVQSQHSLQAKEIDIVGSIDGGGNAIDAVSHWNTAAQNTAVLNVIYAVKCHNSYSSEPIVIMVKVIVLQFTK